MQVRVLGPLEVDLDDGSSASIRAPKVRALLVALVLEAGRTVSIDRLVDAVWEQKTPEQPLAPLRSYVSNLRRLLGPEGVRVVSTGRGYLLDVAPTCVDAFVFERLAARGSEALRDGQPTAAVELLEQALALWRGPALADVDDRDFARPAAVRLEELRVISVEDRLEALLRSGRPEQVVAEVEPLVASHPLRERPRRLLMLALHAAGRTADALAVYQGFREHLAEELGLDPSRELELLTERILQQDPTLGSAPPAVPAASAQRPKLAPRSQPLVGRARERAQLSAAVTRLGRSLGSVVLLAGEPGIGKSALLHEMAAEAAGQGATVGWGRCVETGGAPAFWPWIQVLRTIVEHLDDDALVAATAGRAGGVAHLVPEVVHRTGRTPAASDADAASARFALYDAVVTFLRRAAPPRGLLLVLDDLHWGDPASCELAAFLGTQIAEAPVLLGISYRTVAADRTVELDEALAALLGATHTVPIELTGLSRDEVTELVAELLDRRATEAALDVGELHARAGGNPFFVQQLAQLLVEPEDAGDDRPALPTGIRHLILRRLRRLPGRSQETLQVAAILGRDIDPSVVARCIGRPVSDVLDDLDTGAAHGLVTSPSVPGAGHRFVHALVREALDRELPAGRALRWHLAAADALEALPRPPSHAVAEHLWQAANLVPVERVVHWQCLVAEESVAVFAHEHAERSLRRALRLLLAPTVSEPALELTVRLRLVQILTARYGWTSDEIGEVAAPARDLADEAGIGVERLSLWWSLWTLYTTRGDFEDSRALARQLLADAQRLGRPESLVAGHVAIAYSQLFTGAPVPTVFDHLEQAERAERRSDRAALGSTPEHLTVALQVSRGMACALEGDRDAAVTSLATALTTARELGAPFGEAYARLFAAWAAAVLDDAVTAWEHADAGLTLCEVAGLSYLATLITPVHAWASARRGAEAMAEAARLQAATDALAAAGHRHALAFWQLLSADVCVQAGDQPGAAAAAEAATALAARIGERLDGPLVRRVVAVLAPSADEGLTGGPTVLAADRPAVGQRRQLE